MLRNNSFNNARSTAIRRPTRLTDLIKAGMEDHTTKAHHCHNAG